MTTTATLARAFRADLLAEERRHAAALTRAYRETARRVRHAFEALLAALLAARADGTLSPSWLYEQQRLSRVERTVGMELTGYTARAAAVITSAQEQAVLQAHGDAATLARTAAPDADLRLPDLQALSGRAGMASNGRAIPSLLRPLPTLVTVRTRALLLNGVALDEPGPTFRRGLKLALADGLARTLTTSRTETVDAYRDTAATVYRQNRHALRGWRWLAGLSVATCAPCWSQDGSVYDWSEDLDDHPRGCCLQIPLGIDEADDEYTPDRTFDDLSDADQRAILGPGKLALYQNGDIQLADLVAWRTDPQWGRSIREASIPEALANAARRRGP